MSYTPYPSNTEINTDAGGRTRTSGVSTLFEGKTLGADDAVSWQNVGTGAVTYANNKNTLQVSSGQYVVRRGRRYIPYFSGKSQIIEATFDGFGIQANVEKSVGYYSSNAVAPYNSNLDGFRLFNNGTTISLQCWRNGTLTCNVPWTSWDNYSKISNYDWNSFTVVVFDFLWLGGTQLRLFIKHGGGFELVHTFKWADGSDQDTFILSPNQSVRYELRSTTGTGSFRCICSAVGTEGDTSFAGTPKAIYNPSGIVANNIGTIYALKGIKKLAAFRDTPIRISSCGIVNTTTNDSGIVMLIINPTLSSALSYTTNGKISEGTATNQTITAGTGTLIWAQPSGMASQSSLLDTSFYSPIGMNIDDTSDEYVLAYMPATANQTVFGEMTVKQL